MNTEIKKYYNVINNKFSLSYLSTASTIKPLSLQKNIVISDIFKLPRVNNMLIKTQGNNLNIPFYLDSGIINWINYCLDFSKNVCNDLENRYVYLTIDNKTVLNGESQREDGWHLDGLQGDEVPVKLNNCFQFIYVTENPTEFCIQPFSYKNLNLSSHNIFKKLGQQVNNENIYSINLNTTYLMNSYQLHRAIKSTKDTTRLFLRLYISHCPITSVLATINPNINYPFKPHSTKGKIPSHLT